MFNLDKFQAARAKPTQARGKERVRVILAASFELFRERGLEDVTTNDIAAAAKIPIGSLYRYYPNKDAIIAALTDLYVGDLNAIFADIAKHRFLPYLSWDEVLLLMVDSWVTYASLNGRFAFLYAQKANPRLYAANQQAWRRLRAHFSAVLTKRCPEITEREQQVCFQLSLSAAEMGITDTPTAPYGLSMHHDAVGAIAIYMLKACERHAHAKEKA